MKHYNYDKKTVKIETENALVIVKEGLIDRRGRSVTSVQVIPDRAGPGENICVRYGFANTRVVTLKKKRR